MIYIINNGINPYIELSKELPSDSYKLGTTFEEYLQGDTFVKLSDEQAAFRATNPTAGIKEVWDMKLNTPTAEELLQRAKANKIAEIEEYSNSSNVNNFVINGAINGWLTPDERTRYKASIESDDLLYSQGIITTTTITFRIGGYQVTIERSDAKIMLAQVSNYADKSWLVTEGQIDTVNAMKDVDLINAFDVTKGYPPMLNLTLNLINPSHPANTDT